MTGTFAPGLIMAFREGLEAFLIVAIILRFLEKINNNALKRNVWHGVGASLVVSVALGFVLYALSLYLEQLDAVGKIWESIASLVAVALVGTFIIWMIRHGAEIKNLIEHKATLSLSAWGIFLLTFIFVAREGVEIAIFTFAGKYAILSILIGLALSLVLVLMIFYSLVKVPLGVIFNITLIYLILQAGFLLGYGVHEGLSSFKATGMLSGDSALYAKAYNLSGTALNHKTGVLGLPLNVLIGWYSKPEWIQFIAQYLFTGGMFAYWWVRTQGRKTAA